MLGKIYFICYILHFVAESAYSIHTTKNRLNFNEFANMLENNEKKKQQSALPEDLLNPLNIERNELPVATDTDTAHRMKDKYHAPKFPIDAIQKKDNLQTNTRSHHCVFRNNCRNSRVERHKQKSERNHIFKKKPTGQNFPLADIAYSHRYRCNPCLLNYLVKGFQNEADTHKA